MIYLDREAIYINWVVCLVLATIVIVCVSPVCDVAPPALRASRAAAATLLFLVSASTALATFFNKPSYVMGTVVALSHPFDDDPADLPVLDCSFLCWPSSFCGCSVRGYALPQ